MLDTLNTRQFILDHTHQADASVVHLCKKYSFTSNAFLIQDPGSKNGYTIGVNSSMVTPVQGLCQLFLAVDNDGHGLLLNTDAYTMPPVMNRKNR